MNDNIRQKIYLAALLHDIGKFYERAYPEKYKKDEIYNYSHAVYTRVFVDDYTEIKKIIKKFELKNAKDDYNLINLAAKHHKPSTDAEWLIHWADRFSAATDRFDSENNIPKGKSKRPLSSIFSRVDISEKGQKLQKGKDWTFYSSEKLSLKSNIFPKNDAINSQEKYKKLWTEFLAEFIEIGKTNRIDFFTENLLKLLEKYTAKMPSSARSQEIPDVTLFDHSKTTAGFAVAMHNYLIEKDKKINFTENTNIIDAFTNTNEKFFVLIGGDLSGIQNFIYDITGQNAAKNLKGRSFYLNILTKTFIHHILKRLSLKKSNLIYGSGGTFYILAQNTEQTKKSLNKLTDYFNKALYLVFGVKIFFSTAFVEFGRKEIDNKQIGNIWEKLISKNIEQKKNNKHISNLQEIFKIQKIKGTDKDEITKELINDYKSDKIHNKTVKKITADLIKLGKKLRDADYWIISDKKIDIIDTKYLFSPFYKDYFPKGINNEEFNDLELYHYFIPAEKLRPLADIEIIKFNNTDFILENNYDNILSFEFYGGNKFPLDENDDVKEFTDLAQGEKFDRLGVLRMDVDSLGTIFAKGFDFEKTGGENEITFSRLATLSRSLDLFFSGYLNKIWQKDKYREQTMIIYSGGDDLFIVGRWDLLVDMAFDIHKDFTKYTGFNPNLSISGGIAIVRDKFPILKAAKLSGEYEHKAKLHKIKIYKQDTQYSTFLNKRYFVDEPNVIEKNSFSFLGQVFNWDFEFEILQNLQEKTYNYLIQDKEVLPQGFIQTIINLNELRLETKHKFGQQDWIWKALYYLKRLKMRNLKLEAFVDATADNINKYNNEYSNRQPKLNEFYDDLSVKLLKGKEYTIPKYIDENSFAEDVVHLMDLMSVAVRWAYLKKKTNF